MTSEGLVLYKLMILYMLDRVDFPLTGSQISYLFQPSDCTE